MSELFATENGIGKVYAGAELLGSYEYELRLYHNYVSEGVRGLDRAELDITNPPASGPHPPKRFTLELTDGRKLDFFVSAGRCMVAGFQPPERTP